MVASLDVKLMRMLVAIDQHKTLTKAAESLLVTQSALSHQIRDAERRAGMQFFYKVNKKLHFTEVGAHLLQGARPILDAVDRLEGDLRLYKHAAGPKITIGTGPYSCEEWLPDFIRYWTTQSPAPTQIEIIQHGIDFPLSNAIRSGEIDIGIAPGEVTDPRLGARPLFNDELVGVIGKKSPLRKKSCLGAADFVEETYLTYSTVPERGYEDDQLFRPARLYPKRWLRFGSIGMIVAMIERGGGLSILSRRAVESYEQAGRILLRPLTDAGIHVTWQAVLRTAMPSSSPASRCAAAMAEWCQSHAP